MGRVSREQVTEYQTVGQQLEDAARESVRMMLGNIDLTDEGMWSEVIEIVQQLFGHYGNNAAYLGAQWYQRCRDIQTDGKSEFIAEPFVDNRLYGRITNETKRVLEAVKSGDKTADEAVEAIEASVGNYTAKVNRDTVQENLNRENEAPAKSGRNRADTQKESPKIEAKTVDETVEASTIDDATTVDRDTVQENLNRANERPVTSGRSRVQIQKEKGYRSTARRMRERVKFMRVPRADCKCAFCITMASRGAVYRTRETAGGGDPVNLYHRDCRCSVVPVQGEDPIISEYSDELNHYYETYADAYEYLGDLWSKDPDEYTDEDREIKARIDEAHKRHVERQKADPSLPDWKPINEVSIVMRYQNEGMT